LKKLQSSVLLHTKVNTTSEPPACSDHGLYRILLAGALLFDEKIRQSAAIFWFELRDVGFFKYSIHEP
jgi:hypothetical protein